MIVKRTHKETEDWIGTLLFLKISRVHDVWSINFYHPFATPEFVWIFTFPRKVVKSLHQHRSDRNPFIARWNLLWFAHLQMKTTVGNIQSWKLDIPAWCWSRWGSVFWTDINGDRHLWRPPEKGKTGFMNKILLLVALHHTGHYVLLEAEEVDDSR